MVLEFKKLFFMKLFQWKILPSSKFDKIQRTLVKLTFFFFSSFFIKLLLGSKNIVENIWSVLMRKSVKGISAVLKIIKIHSRTDAINLQMWK